MAQQAEFAVGDHVVYPAHGVGRIDGVEEQTVAGHTLAFYKISFGHERMTLRLPVAKAGEAGLRRLASRERLAAALKTLRRRARGRKAMWSRRAQEYETKINSGDPVALAEVVRDLYRGENQGEQSYSERQLYQAALERLTRELAAVEAIDEGRATAHVTEALDASAAA